MIMYEVTLVVNGINTIFLEDSNLVSYLAELETHRIAYKKNAWNNVQRSALEIERTQSECTQGNRLRNLRYTKWTKALRNLHQKYRRHSEEFAWNTSGNSLACL